jgi:hypothetical protein
LGFSDTFVFSINKTYYRSLYDFFQMFVLVAFDDPSRYAQTGGATVTAETDPRDWNTITANFSPENLNKCNWYEADDATLQLEGHSGYIFMNCADVVGGSPSDSNTLTISENTGTEYRIKVLVNPLFSKMHRPMFPEAYAEFKIDTRYVLSEGTPNTIARKFFYTISADVTVWVEKMIRNLNSLATQPTWYDPDEAENWYDTSYGGGDGYVVDVDTSDMVQNPLYDDAREHCWGWCFRGTGFYFNLKIVRQSMGLGKYRDTGEWVKINTIEPTNYDLEKSNYFSHTEKFSQRMYYDVNNFTPGVGESRADIKKFSKAFNVGGKATGLTAVPPDEVKLRRVADVVSIEKTASNKIKVKVKNIVDEKEYVVCFAGLSGRYTTLQGKIARDANGNQLQTKYKYFTS